MTTPPAPAREHAPWTIRLAAVCAWLRAPVGLLMAAIAFTTGFDPRYQVDGGFPGLLMAVAFLALILSIAWIALPVSLLRRRRWARLTTIALEAVTVLFGGILFVYTDGSTTLGGCLLMFGALALIVVLMGPSAAWCSK